jgi:hypothetical protein
MTWCGLVGFSVYEHWVPGIGDPTFAGWLITVCYLIATFLCAAAAQTSATGPQLGERRFYSLHEGKTFWWAFALLMLLMGINKQLDLQSLCTITARHLAQKEGWYEARRLFQALFVLGIAVGEVGLLWIVWRAARKSVRQHRQALVGGIFLLCFILIRAASFHHVDYLLGFHLGRLRLRHVLEMSGIFWIGFAAAQIWLQQRKSATSTPQKR